MDWMFSDNSYYTGTNIICNNLITFKLFIGCFILIVDILIVIIILY